MTNSWSPSDSLKGSQMLNQNHPWRDACVGKQTKPTDKTTTYKLHFFQSKAGIIEAIEWDFYIEIGFNLPHFARLHY